MSSELVPWKGRDIKPTQAPSDSRRYLPGQAHPGAAYYSRPHQESRITTRPASPDQQRQRLWRYEDQEGRIPPGMTRRGDIEVSRVTVNDDPKVRNEMFHAIQTPRGVAQIDTEFGRIKVAAVVPGFDNSGNQTITKYPLVKDSSGLYLPIPQGRIMPVHIFVGESSDSPSGQRTPLHGAVRGGEFPGAPLKYVKYQEQTCALSGTRDEAEITMAQWQGLNPQRTHVWSTRNYPPVNPLYQNGKATKSAERNRRNFPSINITSQRLLPFADTNPDLIGLETFETLQVHVFSRDPRDDAGVLNRRGYEPRGRVGIRRKDSFDSGSQGSYDVSRPTLIGTFEIQVVEQ